jgi:hypothetical protein
VIRFVDKEEWDALFLMSSRDHFCAEWVRAGVCLLRRFALLAGTETQPPFVDETKPKNHPRIYNTKTCVRGTHSCQWKQGGYTKKARIGAHTHTLTRACHGRVWQGREWKGEPKEKRRKWLDCFGHTASKLPNAHERGACARTKNKEEGRRALPEKKHAKKNATKNINPTRPEKLLFLLPI